VSEEGSILVVKKSLISKKLRIIIIKNNRENIFIKYWRLWFLFLPKLVELKSLIGICV
jgi:hypothetical protein